MRLTRLFILGLSSFLILTACSTKEEEEAKESTTEEKAEPKEVTLNIEVDYIDSNPSEISLSSFDVLRTVSKDGHTYFNNDEECVDITDSVEESALFSVTYQQVVNTLMTVKDKLEHETKDGK